MKRVLIHTCCGPCSIYPFEVLAKEGFYVEGFFYNPNIQPNTEYQKRKEAVENFQKTFGIKVYFESYQGEDYIFAVRSAKDKYSRCKSCFKLRLEKTLRFALENKFDFFTTTLLVSPYQDQIVIKEIGDEISQNSPTKFLFYDFRSGFRQAHNKARELNFYSQKYCGCLASLAEREEEKKQRKAVKC